MSRMKNTNNSPLVSVIMPAYNTEKYVGQAIESILNETYKKYEFIIVDDASTDSTPTILRDFKRKDKRIIILRNKNNLGVTKSLNRALKKARGKYIARMDADDWAYPDRLRLQVDQMEKHPKVTVSGSYIEVCDKNLKVKYTRKYHLSDENIRKHIFRYSPFAHPVTIWRGDVIKKERYDERLKISQDYELYFRVGKRGKFMNLDKPLLKLRIHGTSISATKSDFQLINAVLIRLSSVLFLGYNMTRFDKFYNFIQEVLIGLMPVKWRFYIFNFLRRFDFY